jgi:O-antigen biosynthesis alpha-1,2-mannosyltransferase
MSGRAARPEILLLSEEHIGSYGVVGALMARTLEAAGLSVRHRPLGEAPRHARPWEGRLVIHNTIGPKFAAIRGCRNVALVHPEWDRSPAAWVDRLNTFHEVWVTTTFVGATLTRSGVTVPVRLRRPALDLDAIPRKVDYAPSRPARFFACGAAHFRKGFHLLVEGYLRAFPREGDATLVIHTHAPADWGSPRADIVFDDSQPGRAEMLARYATFDFFVSASLGEGLGLPIAEAILAGVPVITHNWGGHRDLLAEGHHVAVDHDVVPQPFCSRPDYFAAGQRCAVVSVDGLARSFRAAVRLSPERRSRMAIGARHALLRRFGRRAAVRPLTQAVAPPSARPAA